MHNSQTLVIRTIFSDYDDGHQHCKSCSKVFHIFTSEKFFLYIYNTTYKSWDKIQPTEHIN